MNVIAALVLLFSWIWGIVLAKGFWSTLFAYLVPFWSYYLVIEHITTKYF